MKVTFISQASVIIETSDATIWTDPWLFGTAFNDSWKLFPEPEFDINWYEKINFLWISHEHPDHFHFPTLKSLPTEFKEKVILLFQDNNSNKMPDAFKKLGFKNIRLLQNREITPITNTTSVHNFQIGNMDSSLAVICEGKTVLNLNDCEINSSDVKCFKKDLGKIDVLLNQFSMAGYNGGYEYEKILPEVADNILNSMIADHKDLEASITIPIASYVYFCQSDNKFMNEFSNTPQKIHEKFLNENLECNFLSINETFDLNNIGSYNKEMSYQRIKSLFDNRDEKLIYKVSEVIPLNEIEKAFIDLNKQLKSFYPKMILNKLKTIRVYIPDLDKIVDMSLSNGHFIEYKNDKEQKDFDIQIYSQPLFFAFKFTWGIQTLGVSARFLIKKNFKVWKWYRIISSMNNAEFYLKPKYFFQPQNVSYLLSRIGELPGQIRHRMSLSKMN